MTGEKRPRSSGAGGRRNVKQRPNARKVSFGGALPTTTRGIGSPACRHWRSRRTPTSEASGRRWLETSVHGPMTAASHPSSWREARHSRSLTNRGPVIRIAASNGSPRMGDLAPHAGHRGEGLRRDSGTLFWDGAWIVARRAGSARSRSHASVRELLRPAHGGGARCLHSQQWAFRRWRAAVD